MDRLGHRHTDRWSGGVRGARWGWDATHLIWRVGGPLDQGIRGLGRVELHSCRFKVRKTCLGVSRMS